MITKNTNTVKGNAMAQKQPVCRQGRENAGNTNGKIKALNKLFENAKEKVFSQIKKKPLSIN